MTSADQLKDILERFEHHAHLCEQCDLGVSTTWRDRKLERLNIGINVSDKPKLCQTGKELLLDIFA